MEKKETIIKFKDEITPVLNELTRNHNEIIEIQKKNNKLLSKIFERFVEVV